MPYAKGERKRKPESGLAPRACVTCGAEFIPYRVTQWACSQQCGKRTPKALETAKKYRDRPEVKERAREIRRLSTTPHPERVRRYNLRGSLARYGVTLEWYEAKLAEQDGRCILCGHVPPPDGIKAASRLHVDHDHTTGVVRDLLCSRCNQGIGYFREDSDLLRRTADYIERHRG